MLWLGGLWHRVNGKLLQQGEMEEAGGKDGANEVQPLPQGSVFGDSAEADLRLRHVGPDWYGPGHWRSPMQWIAGLDISRPGGGSL